MNHHESSNESSFIVSDLAMLYLQEQPLYKKTKMQEQGILPVRYNADEMKRREWRAAALPMKVNELFNISLRLWPWLNKNNFEHDQF